MRGQQKWPKKLHRTLCMQLVGAMGVEEDMEEVLGRDEEGEVVPPPNIHHPPTCPTMP